MQSGTGGYPGRSPGIEEALMTQKEVADEIRLSPGTISHMVNGHPTSRLSVRKVLSLLSQKLGRRIEIEDVEGLNITYN